MRNKNFVFVLCSAAFICLMIVVFGPQKPDSFQNIVTSTHQHIRNFQVSNVGLNPASNEYPLITFDFLKDDLKDAEEKNLVTDEKFLKLLGFVERPRLFPNDTWRNTSLPIVVTYVLDGQESLVIGLINNVARALPNNTLLVYHFGLGSYALQNVSFLRISRKRAEISFLSL